MGISETHDCIKCNIVEAIEHVYIECDNFRKLWNTTENWVRTMYNPHFKIPDSEKTVGEKYNDCIKHMIITSVKVVIW